MEPTTFRLQVKGQLIDIIYAQESGYHAYTAPAWGLTVRSVDKSMASKNLMAELSKRVTA